MTVTFGLQSLQKKLLECRKCSRLVRYLADIRKKFPDYWCRPVPAFGDFDGQILILGLAPGRFGSNRTGRMFTGDASGSFLYPVLFEAGLASQPESKSLDDGLELRNCLITAVARGAPPQNKPLPKELVNCRTYWQAELRAMRNLKVVVALGKVAHDEYIRYRLEGQNGRMKDFEFRHGALHRFDSPPRILIDTYHPSRQNTNTGKLTKKMFLDVFKRAVQLRDCAS